MADEGEVDVLGDFDFKLEAESDMYDANELPSKSANLLPEYTNPPWMLEQGWPLDNCMDEKSKATIEKMLMEEQYYINGKSSTRSKKRLPLSVSLSQLAKKNKMEANTSKDDQKRSTWTEDEKQMFHKGLEIFGRSWTKISELIPTRTSIQIKNFAHQYFKQQKKEASPSESRPGEAVASTSVSTDAKDHLADTMARVTTASPTVTARGSILPRKGRIPKAEKEKLTLNKTYPHKTKTSPVKKQKKEMLKIKTQQRVKKHCELKKHLQKGHHNMSNINDDQNIQTESLAQTHVTLPHSLSLDLSPVLLDHKMKMTPGLIENLDGFCAVADIVSGGNEDAEDDDIDIENEDENDMNPVLQSRSISPNSIYEKLVSEANLKLELENDTMNPELAGDSLTDEYVDHPEEIKSDNDDDDGDGGGVGDRSGGGDEVEHTCSTANEQQFENNGTTCVAAVKDELPESSGEQEESNEVTPEKMEDVAVVEVKEELPKVFANVVVNCDGEMIHFPIPVSEAILQHDLITEEEKTINKEFFDNRPSKTPERYLRIRNYIVESWKKCKPNYLNKTSVRPGLKNCGDVNCIGRVHAYLECTGAINFGCDQAAYRHPRPSPQVYCKEKINKDPHSETNFDKLESMRPRKRKVKDAFGLWIDEKELEGKTIEHSDSFEGGKEVKPRQSKSLYDPFKLIPCLPFTEESPAPFLVEIRNSALIVMDIHSHISKTEVIGMLGGMFCEDQGKLMITMATPCNSISTGMQCEMDPVSQTQASEEIRGSGMEVVGWYHSHPTFAPNPSVRDIETQLKFQEWFAKGGRNFVGIIVSPYNPRNGSLYSEINCLTVSDEILPLLQCNIPYKFEYTTRPCYISEVSNIILTAQDLATSHMAYKNKVDLTSVYSVAKGITCLEKMLESLKLHYPGHDKLCVLDSIKKAFTSEDFTSSDNSEASQMSLDSQTDSVNDTGTPTESLLSRYLLSSS